MTRTLKYFLTTWIVTALVATTMWLIVRDSSLDRVTVHWLAQSTSEKPVSVSGKGNPNDPWQIQSTANTAAAVSPPTAIALKDNLEGIFQSSPHSALDLAVIFKNLHRLETKKLACSVMLAWEEPDPIALTAMEMALLDFDSVVLAAPVTRGPVMEVMPTSFRRASLPLEHLAGDPSLLPVVNRISIPNMIHGGDNAMTGFEVIDSEPTTEHLHLMARWDDRVILSFPVLAALQYLDLKPEDLIIKVGSHLQLSEAGPIVPIDEFGRLAIDQVPASPKTDLLAQELIDADSTDAQLPDMQSALLTDLRSHADITSRDFNRLVRSSIFKLMQGETRVGEMTVARLKSSLELSGLLVFALLLSLCGLMGRRVIALITVFTIGGIILATWLSFEKGLWLPIFEAFFVTAVALAYSACTEKHRKRTTSMPRLDRLKFDSLDDKKDPPL